MMSQHLNTSNLAYELLFRASEHDFNDHKFHLLCDDKGPTLVLISSEEGQIFGGYTPLSWKVKSGLTTWKFDESLKSFIFLLKTKTNFESKTDKNKLINFSSENLPIKLVQSKDGENAGYDHHGKTIGCTKNGSIAFGYGADIGIRGNIARSYATKSYFHEEPWVRFTSRRIDLITGDFTGFKVRDYEVFSVKE